MLSKHSVKFKFYHKFTPYQFSNIRIANSQMSVCQTDPGSEIPIVADYYIVSVHAILIGQQTSTSIQIIEFFNTVHVCLNIKLYYVIKNQTVKLNRCKPIYLEWC